MDWAKKCESGGTAKPARRRLAVGRAQAQSTAPMRWSSIDPATSSGVAIWSGTRLLAVHRIVSPTHADWRRVLDGCSLVVAEGRVRAGKNGKNAREATAAIHRVLHDAAREVGARVVVRRPCDWRPWLGIKNDSRSKAAARSMLRGLWRQDPTLEAVSDAVESPDIKGRSDEFESVAIGVAYSVEMGWRGGDGLPTATTANGPVTAKECVR